MEVPRAEATGPRPCIHRLELQLGLKSRFGGSQKGVHPQHLQAPCAHLDKGWLLLLSVSLCAPQVYAGCPHLWLGLCTKLSLPLPLPLQGMWPALLSCVGRELFLVPIP